MDDEQQKKHRIGWFAILVLVFLALVCDLLGLIPFVKDFLGTIFWICASIYFWMIGMGIFNGRKLAVMAISWIASLIPVIQEIPLELVVGIIVIIAITRVEEKTGLSLTSGLLSGELHGKHAQQITQRSARTFAPLNKDGGRSPVNTRVPLNQNGVRAPKKESEDDIKRRERSERTRKAIEDSRKATNDRLATEAEKSGIREKGNYVEDASSPTGHTYKYGDVKRTSDDEILGRSG